MERSLPPLLCTIWALFGLALPGYYRFLYYEVMAWSLLALSVDILYGQAGLLSFGQSVYFALAGYTFINLCAVDKIGVLGAAAIGLFFTLVVAGVLGIFMVRLSGHFFVLATVILSLSLFLIASTLTTWTGGDDGLPLSHMSKMLIGPIRLPDSFNEDRRITFAAAGAITASLYWLIWKVRGSLFGLAIAGMKNCPVRMWVLGFRIRSLQYLIWCVAAFVSGVGGILVVSIVRYGSASFFHWTTSGEGVVWAVLGGLNTVWGAWVGTGALIYAKDQLSAHFAFYPIIVGSLLILLVHLRSEGLLRLRLGRLTSIRPWKYVCFAFSEDARSNITASLEPTPIDLVIRSARKLYEGTAAIDGCDLRLSTTRFELRLSIGTEVTISTSSHPFPVVAFIGPNGAGKTTLLNLLCGYFRPDQGGLKISGREVALPRANPMIGRSFKHPQLFERLSVGENLLIGAMRGISPGRYRQPASRSAVLKQQVLSLASRLELRAEMNQLVSELCYGRRKLVDIAIALASRPSMLLLDEPTAGVSPHEVALIIEVILDLANRLPVILVEHNLEVVRRLDFDVVFMAEGKFVAYGDLQAVLENPQVRQLFTGERLHPAQPRGVGSE